MAFASFIPMIIGGAMDTAGTIINAGEASKRKKKAEEIANTPGVDTGVLTGQALSNQLNYLPQGINLAKQISAANQAQLQAREEAALPGVGAARQQALGRITGLFADDSNWLKGVQQRGAALGLSSGLFGSQAGQLQTLRLSDQEQMQRTQLGTGLLGSLISSMRIANTPGVQAFLGPTPDQLINLRSQERTQRLGMLSGANMLKSGAEVWGDTLQRVGEGLAGVGTGSMLSGGGMGGGGMGSSGFSTSDYFQNQRMMGEAGMGGGGAFPSYMGDINFGGFAGGMA